MLGAQGSELSIAAVAVILLADAVLANVIVQPSHEQVAAYHPSLQPKTIPHEEREHEHETAAWPQQNVHYGHQYLSADYYPSEGQPPTFGHPPNWQSPQALPIQHSNVPKIVHPLHVAKIGDYGYVHPSFVVGQSHYPTYAVPASRHRRSADEKDSGNSDAVASNPTLINISAKLPDVEDEKLEDLQAKPLEETDETRQKREKRIDVRQTKNEEMVGHSLGLDSEKMLPGYHQYRPPVMMQQIRRSSQFSPPYTVQSGYNVVAQQATPHPEKQAAPAPSSQSQQASANVVDDKKSSAQSQASEDDKKQQMTRKKKDENSDSSNKNIPEKKSSNPSEPEIIIHNAPAQPVKRQDIYADDVNINVDSGNTMMSLDPNGPSGPTGPFTPSGSTGPFIPSGPDFEGGMFQEDYMLGSTQRCGGKICGGLRNYPDPRPHKHKKGHQCNICSYPRQASEQVTTSRNKSPEVPVAQNAVESANTCDCQPSVVQPYSLSNSFYIVPIRPIEPLHLNRLSMLGCNNMNAMLENAQQVYHIPQEQTDVQSAEKPATKYIYSPYSPYYNYMSSYRSGYGMPYYQYASPYYQYASPYYARCGYSGTGYA